MVIIGGIFCVFNFMTKQLLVQEYKQLVEENLKYVVQITDRELEHLTETVNFIAIDQSVDDRVSQEFLPEEAENKIAADNEVDELVAALSLYSIREYIVALVIKGEGDTYYYNTGFGLLAGEESLFENYEGVYTTTLQYVDISKSLNLGSTNSYVLKFMRGIVGTQSNSESILYLEMETSFLEDLLYDNREIMDMRVTVVDSNNAIVFDNENSDLVNTQYVDTEGGVVVKNSLDYFGWSIICQTESIVMQEEYDQINIMIFLICGVLAFLSAGFIQLLWKWIVKPIEEVSQGMRVVREGDYQVQLEQRGADEMGQLIDDFNDMSNKLQSNLEREVENAQKIKDAEYRTLQAQINPHFMYNSLNTIKYIASMQNQENIVSLVNSLWTLLKDASNVDGQLIPLEKEIEIIKAYTHIEEVRYKGKFNVSYEIDEDTKGIIIPKYILEPLVENAIFHGIIPKKIIGTIIIRTRLVGDDLEIKVIDDGIGMEQDKIMEILHVNKQGQKTTKPGFNNIGVYNVNERMMLSYGDEYGLIIKSAVNEGTMVVLRFPVNKDDTIEG